MRNVRMASTMQSMASMKERHELKKKKIKLAWAIGGALAIGGTAAYVPLAVFNDHTKTVTITEKERVVRGDSSQFMVWGEDQYGEVHAFRNTDIWMRGKFDSADVQGNLREGETYELTLIGHRVRILSWFPNIIGFEQVEDDYSRGR